MLNDTQDSGFSYIRRNISMVNVNTSFYKWSVRLNIDTDQLHVAKYVQLKLSVHIKASQNLT